MNLLRDLSIRHKLLVITLIIGSVALLVATAAFVCYDYFTFRETMVKELFASADSIAANSTAAISFNDQKAATETLGSLRTIPEVIAAEIRDGNGNEFTQYLTPGNVTPTQPDTLAPDKAFFTPDALIVCRSIRLDGKTIGSIRLSSNLSRLHGRMRSYAIALVVVLAIGLSASMLVISRLQRIICDPILDLTQTARKIARDKSYSLRAHKFGDDELGELTECFNNMLQEIASRDVELAGHRDQLEEQVRVRTEELRAARDKAEAASRAKSAFLANMSHEIRTPMTAIVGYADMLMESRQNLSDRLDYLQVIQRNAKHLVSLINDILDLSKIEADRMTVEHIPCDLPQLIFEVISMMRPRAIEKGLAFRCIADRPIPKIIQSDSLRLKQILVNLIGNAIKFTERGEIALRVNCEVDDGNGTVSFHVRDDGIGMDAEKLNRLFQPFMQADESMTRRYGGTGLGLAISKRLAMLLQGDITATSTPGAGSTFSIRISTGPLTDVQRVSLDEAILQQHAEHEEQSGDIVLDARILLAEDGPDNQRLISAYLRQSGADVVVVENGRLAVERLKVESFDLVLMDMQMPEMDGYTASRYLRTSNYTLPIVALTAHAMAEDRGKCLDAGCTDYLTKPIDRKLLLGTLARYVKHRISAPATTRAAAPASPPAAAVSAQRLRSTHADNAAMYDLIGEFVAALPERVAAMTDLLAQQNLEQLQRKLHQLKGAGSGYGFPMITKQAAAAESSIKQHEALNVVAEKVQALIALTRSVEGYQELEQSHSINATATGREGTPQ